MLTASRMASGTTGECQLAEAGGKYQRERNAEQSRAEKQL
jgi:hypothetical protein